MFAKDSNASGSLCTNSPQRIAVFTHITASIDRHQSKQQQKQQGNSGKNPNSSRKVKHLSE